MLRSPEEDRRLQMMARLPELVRILRSYPCLVQWHLCMSIWGWGTLFLQCYSVHCIAIVRMIILAALLCNLATIIVHKLVKYHLEIAEILYVHV